MVDKLQWGPASRAGRGLATPAAPVQEPEPLQWGPASRAGRGSTSPARSARCTSGFNGARLREPGEGAPPEAEPRRQLLLQWGPASRAGRGPWAPPPTPYGTVSGFNGARLREPGEGLEQVGVDRDRDGASMGPGFESRERAPGQHQRFPCDADRFNGARLREPGEGDPGPRGWPGAACASMGPGFESRERAGAGRALRPWLVPGLQWGPASRAGRGTLRRRLHFLGSPHGFNGARLREPGEGGSRRRGESAARRCFNGARLREPGEGGQLRPAHRGAGGGASMGPGFESRERGPVQARSRPSTAGRFNGARLREPGEGREIDEPFASLCRFNGARLREPGEGERDSRMLVSVQRELQWGPASRAGRGTTPAPSAARSRSRFNGARLREPGEGPWSSAPPRPTPGRFNGARLREPGEGSSPQSCVRYTRECASMGPGFESRERVCPVSTSRPSVRLLQWGPASRAGRGAGGSAAGGAVGALASSMNRP